MASKEDQKGVFDVSKPGSTPPDSSAKPIIVSHKPLIKDPTLKDEVQENDKPDEKLKAPSEKAEQSKTVIKPLDEKITSQESEKPENQPTEKDNDTNKSANQEQAVVDAVVSQTSEKKQKKIDEEDAQENRDKINKLVESKKYFVKIRPAKSKRKKRAFVIILLVILLALTGIGLAADAEVIDIDVPFDFIKIEKPVVEIPVSSTVEPEQPTQESDYLVPEGYQVFENGELGYKFVYPNIYGEFKLNNNIEGSDMTGVDNYYESENPSTATIVGSSGPFSLYQYNKVDQVVSSVKYGPELKFENNKWIVVSINPADTINKVGEEYIDLDGKTVNSVTKNGTDVYSFTFKTTDEGCKTTKIVFIAKEKLNSIYLPTFCYESTDPSDDNKKSVDSAYKELYENVLNSITKV